MIKKINAIGQACPLPVIKTKQALKEHDRVEVQVDNEIATQNLKKLAEQKGYQFNSQKISNKEFAVVIVKSGDIEQGQEVIRTVVEAEAGDYIVVVDTNTMGRGDDKLGATLINGFFYALTEQDRLPKKVILYNGGVKFALASAVACEDLLKLQAQGVAIYNCGACTDFYGITEEIAVGEITNMYHIVEMMSAAVKIVKP